MPSQNIVRDIRVLIQSKLLPSMSGRWSKQLSFGMQAYGLHTFQSVAGNARMTVANAHTAVRKSERLFQNTGLAAQLGAVFDSLNLVRPSTLVNVDHSDVNQLTALVGAIQTRNGRAIPCFVETTYAPRIPGLGSQRSTPRTNKLRQAMTLARKAQSFTGHTIDALQGFADRLGFWPKLVFDRGFANESLVTHLAAEGCTFYIRLKAGRFVELDGQRTEVKQLRDKDASVQLFGMTLRVIRSPRSRRAKEPWYILTNDHTGSRPKIVRVYYHRFEIEETFKDMKHIFELKRTRLNKPLSLKMLLWFVSLGIALLYAVTKPTRRQRKDIHPKKQTSWLRQAYEQYQQGCALLVWGDG